MASNAPTHVWLQQKSDSGWEPFRTADQRALEAAHEAGQPDVVAVDGARMEVHMAERVLRCRYWGQPPQRVVRSLWCCDGAPYDEAHSDVLEDWYQHLQLIRTAAATPGATAAATVAAAAAAAGVVKWNAAASATDDAAEVVEIADDVTMERTVAPASSSPSKAIATLSLGDGAKQVYMNAAGDIFQTGGGKLSLLCRGGVFRPAPTPVPDTESVEHLVLNLHGIGEKLWSKNAFYQKSLISQIDRCELGAHPQHLPQVSHGGVGGCRCIHHSSSNTMRGVTKQPGGQRGLVVSAKALLVPAKQVDAFGSSSTHGDPRRGDLGGVA